ncbi:hypothetical protein RH915_03465 [Serpentinicella sp. ANB-PHB4]|uniref:hypothetical protein n=1 Tax=Serpentinicella sp. ANB-PHB4 TaxID=3074076 RepID=UPI00285FA762|nr:hypothetical protein [Serpentinicella sp. ANB-PHB4]MDR5658542.1 hypothetical protein [Serpentinicella sp. ANB-PHB4]
MGFILEFIFEIIIEGSFEFAKSDRAPNIFKNFVILVIFSGIVLFLWLSFMMREEKIMMYTFIGVALIITIFLYSFLKELKRGKI